VQFLEGWVEAQRLLAPPLKVSVGSESTSPNGVSTLSLESPAPGMPFRASIHSLSATRDAIYPTGVFRRPTSGGRILQREPAETLCSEPWPRLQPQFGESRAEKKTGSEALIASSTRFGMLGTRRSTGAGVP